MDEFERQLEALKPGPPADAFDRRMERLFDDATAVQAGGSTAGSRSYAPARRFAVPIWACAGLCMAFFAIGYIVGAPGEPAAPAGSTPAYRYTVVTQSGLHENVFDLGTRRSSRIPRFNATRVAVDVQNEDAVPSLGYLN